jgi:GT2 family glycosyltransferase
MELAVVTLSRTAEHLAPLTESLDAQAGAPPFGRILVDNGVAEYPAEFLRKWAVLRPGRNTSFAEGNNLAVGTVRKVWGGLTHVLLLNDDAIMGPNAIAALWAQRNTAAVVGALLLNSDGSVNHAGARVWPREGDPHVGRGASPAEFAGSRAPVVQAVTFACALIDLRVWDQLGGLFESYVYGYEDTDFCLRALEAGHLIRVAYAAVGVHDECGTRARGGDRDRGNAELFLARFPDRKVERIAARLAARVRQMEGA